MKHIKLKWLVILTLVSHTLFANAIPKPDSAGAADGKSFKNYKTPNVKGTNPSQQYAQYKTSGVIENSFSNRDTYVNAANDYGYYTGSSVPNISQDLYTASSINSDYQSNNAFSNPTAWYYQITPNHNPWTSYNPISSYSGGNDLYDDDDSGSSGGWLCRMFWGDSCNSNKRQEQGDREGTVESIAALGIFGVVAFILKKIGLFKIAPLLPILIPALPIILPIVLIGGVIIGLPLLIAAFFLPIVPVIVIGRSLQASSSWARSAKDALMKEDCVERITCEASRFARGYGFEAKWIDGYLKNSSKKYKWMDKISKARNADCKSYTCHPVSSFKKALHFKDE